MGKQAFHRTGNTNCHKHMEKSFMSFKIRDMQSKIIMRCHCTVIILTKISLTISSASEDVKHGNSLTHCSYFGGKKHIFEVAYVDSLARKFYF